MRTPLDRLRHALSFEIIALLLIVPLGSVVFHMPTKDLGVVGLAGASFATAWNYVFNLGFDVVLRRVTGETRKSLPLRLLHALLFEAGLLVALLPFIAWYLGISLGQALLMDLSFALFYMVYALVFGWVYDRLFPLPEWKPA